MKKRIFICAVLMASALCLASCDGVSPDPASSTAGQSSDSSTQNDEYIPEKDADGNTIEVVEVTDAQGEVVKDEAGKPVTELNIVDDKGTVITDASGNKAKPNIPSKPTKTSPSPSASAGNGSNGNNSSNNGGNDSGNSTPSKASDELVAFLWYGDSKVVNGKAKFDCITSDTDILEITFKIKDGAKNGKYEVKYYEDGDHSSSFCDDSDDIQSIPVTYVAGVIGVNESVSDNAIPSSGLTFAVSSAEGKPGDTVTVKCSLNHVSTPVAAFNSYLSYDTSVLEPVSVKNVGFIEKSGNFTSNVK
ncbi:MAG: hypothetical protein IJL67_07530 [Oscillospiraceae bacterium]|nr:hypothetical protein [Oscillospiraceae bacterium]